ncbi:regulatory protein RecX [Croceivirga thetidis]|uniref:Regulatory protein RecX n=1 Tax=Croceivirga thetidis TaxID=2721623 RepID=A0ABX1GNL1_9FLAO|nr:regulatory protein RecX [Croceivirga thetidis]NKI31516.1 RecX family transcriptional regulator [Croceivirga thetidis]
MNHYSTPVSVQDATKKLEYYCAYQDRCHKEVVAKLKGLGMVEQAIDHIVAHLIKENYLNEERFAKSFARGKFRVKKWGKNRIVQELKMRDISRFNIQSALKEISEEEYLVTLDSLAKKRNKEIKETHPQKRKKKLADYLLYRGWESHLIYQKISELLN